jgi:AcrR family transcriptional regulator
MARTSTPGTRERIVAAVVPLFSTRGVRAVGMAEIVATAGCGKNLLYSHFPGKSELAAAYLHAVRRERERSAERALAAAEGDAALALVGEIADRVREPGFRGCAMRNYLTEFPAGDDEPARIARDYLASSRAQLAGHCADPLLADRLWLVVEALYAVAGRPDAARQAEIALTWAKDLASDDRNIP